MALLHDRLTKVLLERYSVRVLLIKQDNPVMAYLLNCTNFQAPTERSMGRGV